jgi:molybdenum cofactor cytidylyltransferase
MQSFAIIPAAGLSRRMGQHKLLLPWRGATVIEHVLAAWRASRVDRVILVAHPSDRQLAELGAAAGAEVVRPESPPPEMKDSVRLGLQFASRYQPAASDAWLLAPADMPGLKSATIDRMISAYEADLARAGDRIYVPRFGRRQGHPVLFPWSMAQQVTLLAAGEGVNALLGRNPIVYVEAAEDAVADDLDTPEDYQRLRGREAT